MPASIQAGAADGAIAGGKWSSPSYDGQSSRDWRSGIGSVGEKAYDIPQLDVEISVIFMDS